MDALNEAKHSLGELLHTDSAMEFRQQLRKLRRKVALDQGVKKITPTYEVVVHDASAWRSGNDWVVPLEAWVFRRNEDRHNIRTMLCQKLLIEMNYGIKDVDEAAQQRYEERARLIFRNIAFRGGEDRRSLKVRLGGKGSKHKWELLPVKTNSFGRISTELRLPQATVEDLVSGSTEAVHLEMRGMVPGYSRHLATGNASVRFIVETGLSCISDIDDTVKVTEVFLGQDAVVKNTFFEEFSAVPGMQKLLSSWAQHDPSMSFHFVSNSPPEFLEPLRTFLRTDGFPLASIHLRPLLGKDRSSFKRRTIELLLERFPRRRFVLIGDSGEADAAIYADLLRRHPGHVAKVLIREVHPTRLVDESVFDGLDKEYWQVFRDPSEVVPWWGSKTA